MEVPGCPSLNCENCPDGLIKTDAPVDRKTGCQIGCGTCECPPQPMCMPPENYISHTPPVPDINGCITECGTFVMVPECPPAPKCAQPNCEDASSPTDEDGCVIGCPVCPMPPPVVCPEVDCPEIECDHPKAPVFDSTGCQTSCPGCEDDEVTCNLVEDCMADEKNCFRAIPCDDRNTVYMAQLCEGSDCVYTKDNIPLKPCESEYCTPIQSNDLDTACPPPVMCPTVMLMCDGLYTPVDDNGCTVGCPTCPDNGITEICQQLVDQYGLKIVENLQQEVPADQVCGILDLCSSADTVECSACEFIVNYAESAISTNHTATQIVADVRKECDILGLIPSSPPPRDDRKSPSPPPPPRDDRKSPSPPPPRDDRKSPFSPLLPAMTASPPSLLLPAMTASPLLLLLLPAMTASPLLPLLPAMTASPLLLPLLPAMTASPLLLLLLPAMTASPLLPLLLLSM